MSCIVRSKLMYCSGCDWWMTLSQVGHVLFSSRCLTRQLLQTAMKSTDAIGKWWGWDWSQSEIRKSGRITRRRNLHVWRHSVTVVASMKYPLHILHVMWLFMLFSLIFLSISDQFTDYEWAEKRNEGNTWTCSELRVALPVDFVRNQECSPTIEPLWGKCWCPLGCRQSQGTTRNVWEGGLFTLPIRTRRLFCNYLGQRGINSILTMAIHRSFVVTWNTTEMYTNW